MVTFDGDTSVGRVVVENMQHFAQHPSQLKVPLEDVLQRQRQQSGWRGMLAEAYRNGSEHVRENRFVLLVVHDGEVARGVCHDMNIPIIDCREHDPRARMQSLSDTGDNGGQGVQAICVLNGQTLPEHHRQNIVRLALGRFLLVLCIPKLDPSFTDIRISDRSQIHHFSAVVLTACLAEEDLVTGGDSDVAVIVFRALRLLRGPECDLQVFHLLARHIRSAQLGGMLAKHLYPNDDVDATTLVNIVEAFGHKSLDECEGMHERLAFLASAVARRQGFASDVPFSVFVSHTPLCEWLCMSDRVEAYVRSVLGYGQPDVHFVHQYGHRSNIITTDLLRYFCDRHWETDVGGPAYTSLGSESLCAKKDMALQICIQQEELNWKQLSMEWRNFPYSMAVLLTLLQAYDQPLKLLSLLPPQTVFKLFENVNVAQCQGTLQRLVHLISQQNRQSLERLSASGCDAFVSALKWALLSSGMVVSGYEVPGLTAADLSNLVQHHIPFGIPDKDPNGTLALVMKLSDPVDIFVKEPRMRDYLLKMSRTEAANILEEEDYPVGVAIWDFVANAQIRKRIAVSVMYQGHSSASLAEFINHEWLRPFVRWLEGKEEGGGLECVEHRLLRRLTSDTFAWMLTKCTTYNQTTAVANLYRLHSELMGVDISSSLADMAKRAVKQQASLHHVILLLCQFISTPAWVGHVFVDAVMQMCKDGDLQALLDLFRRDPSAVHRLPVEDHPPMLQRYVAYFDDARSAGSDEVVAFHCHVLSSFGVRKLRAQLGQHLSPEHRILAWTAWALDPCYILPHSPGDDYASFERIIKHPAVRFVERVAAHKSAVTSFALYLTEPWYLDLSTLSAFDKMMRRPVIPERSVVVCCKGRQDYPTVRLRMHRRFLPECVLRDLHGYRMQYLPAAEDDDRVRFDVSSGVSAPIVSQNLQGLIDLPLKRFGFDNSFLQGGRGEFRPFGILTGQRQQDAMQTRVCVALVILGWFHSLGLPPDSPHMRRWVQQMEESASVERGTFSVRLEGLIDEVRSHSLQARVEDVCLHPLPTYYDLRVQAQRHCYRLFGNTPEEGRFTLQCFEGFLACAPDADTARIRTFDPNDLVNSPDEYEGLPEVSSAIFGHCIAKHLNKHRSEAGESQLTDLENLLHPFTACLTKIQSEAPRFVVTMLHAFINGISSCLPEEQASVHLALFRQIGCSSATAEQLQNRVLEQYSNRGGLHAAEVVIKELLWMEEHGWMSIQQYPHLMVATPQYDNYPELTYSTFLEDSAGRPTAIIPDPRFSGCLGSVSDLVQSEVSARPNRVSLFVLRCISARSEPISVRQLRGNFPEVTSSSKARLAMHTRSVLCQPLLQVVSKAGYSVLKIKPGGPCSLVDVGNGRLEFLDATSTDTRSCRALRRYRSINTVVANFPNHHSAFNYMDRLSGMDACVSLAVRVSENGPSLLQRQSEESVPFTCRFLPLLKKPFPYSSAFSVQGQCHSSPHMCTLLLGGATTSSDVSATRSQTVLRPRRWQQHILPDSRALRTWHLVLHTCVSECFMGLRLYYFCCLPLIDLPDLSLAEEPFQFKVNTTLVPIRLLLY